VRVGTSIDNPITPTPQNHQLMSERCILCLKLALRLEWRGHERKE
jgi:hypothetical protein